MIFEAVPGLTLCSPTSVIQGNSKGLDQKWDGVVVCGPGDVNGLKPKSAVVTKCCQWSDELVLLLETLRRG